MDVCNLATLRGIAKWYINIGAEITKMNFKDVATCFGHNFLDQAYNLTMERGDEFLPNYQRPYSSLTNSDDRADYIYEVCKGLIR